MSELATGTSARTSAVERAIFLQTFFGWNAAGNSSSLAEIARDVAFSPGEVLYKQGAIPAALYLINEGVVQCEADGLNPWTFHEGDGVGFTDAMIGRPHVRTAVAQSFVRAVRIGYDDWLDFLDDNFGFVRTGALTQAGHLQRLALRLAPNGGFGTPKAAHPEGRQSLMFVDVVARLRANPLFADAGMQALVVLARLAEPIRLAPGEPLYDATTSPQALLIVGTGLIECRCREPELRAQFGAGDLVGGLCTIGDIPPILQARAEAPSVVLRIRQDDWFDVMEDHFDLVRSFFSYASNARERLLLEIERRGGEPKVNTTRPPPAIAPV